VRAFLPPAKECPFFSRKRTGKPKEPPTRLSDGGGLFLSSEGELARINYKFNKRQKELEKKKKKEEKLQRKRERIEVPAGENPDPPPDTPEQP
jgi:hypothetical protein